LNCGHV